MNFVKKYSSVNIHYYYQELFTKKWDGHSPISDHIAFYYDIHCHFLEADHNINDQTIINVMLMSLPDLPVWEIIKQSLLQQGKGLKIDDVSTKLSLVYEQKSHKNSISIKTVALISKNDSKSSGSKDNSRKTKKG